ncbi:MAG: polysaccharide biosynthesis C-terminal domain-containing protein [Candidatus Bathyarchaeota archaeon]|nr:polysaccharide biosynthesis C-terminal domain-containing protein [Candidatus Bathyarchaeota archaeon]
MFWFKDTVEQLFKSIDFYPYFSYAIITALFMTYELVPKIILQVRERANHYLVISILTLLFRTIPIIWQVVYLEAGAVGMLKGAMYGSAATLIFLIPITLKNIKINFNYLIFKKTMAYCLPLIPMVASAWVVNMSDRLFIEHYFTTYDVGIYSLGYKMGEVVQFLAVSLLMAYNPYFYKLANTQDQTFAKKQLHKLNNLSIVFLLFISFIVAIFSKDVLLLFFNENYFEAYKIIPLIILGYFFIQLVSLQSLSFHQAKKTLPIMVINVGAAVINILLNFLLIKKYGFYGAAVSTVITQGLLFIIIYYFSKRYYFIPYNFKIIVPIFFALVFIYFINTLYLPVTYYFFIGKILTILTLISIVFVYNKKYSRFSFT